MILELIYVVKPPPPREETFSSVGLSKHIIKEALYVPKELRISVWEGFVVVSDSCEELLLILRDSHDNLFFFHFSISFCLTIQRYYKFSYYTNIYYNKSYFLNNFHKRKEPPMCTHSGLFLTFKKLQYFYSRMRCLNRI